MGNNQKIHREKFFKERLPLYQENPVLYAEEVLMFTPDQWQKAVLRDLAGNAKVAVKSGQGVGKTGLEAVALLWFLTCFPYPRVVATAPTKQQLHDVLWSEVAKWQEKSPLLKELLKWTKTYVYMKGYEKRWFAVARTATKPENMQGFHEDHMLFIVDEASGVVDTIMEAVLGTLSGDNNKLLLCGNPTRNSGTFFDAFHADQPQYKCHTISSRNSPRTNKDNIISLEKKYGTQSNVVRVRVDGEFPLQEDDIFLPLAWIEGSLKTEMQEATAKAFGNYYNAAGEKIVDRSGVYSIDIGCDVARFGNDKTCIGYKVNEAARMYKKYNGQDTTWTAGNLAQLYIALVDLYKFKGNVYVKIDDGGVGGGVTDQLKALKRKNPERYASMVIVPLQFGQPISHKFYYDSTTLMMGVIREMIQPFDEEGKQRVPMLILPEDVDLVGQLSSRKYGYVGGKVKVESKKEMKGRGLRSPDEADCMLLTCYPVKRKVR